MATFSSLMINTAGTYQLAVTDGTLPALTSGNVAIGSAAPAVASQLVFQQAPAASAVVNDNLRVQVAVEDKYGNLVTSDNSTVTLTLASGTFWTGSSTATAVASNGIATFYLSFYKAGTYTVAASDGSLTGVTSSPITINPAAASKLVFQQAPPVSGTAGTTLSPVIVAVEDKYGNLVTSDNSTITLTLSHGTFSNGSTSVTAQVVNGVATFSSLMINTAGTYQLAVTDGTLPALTSGNVAISSAAPAAASQLVFQQVPAASAVVNDNLRVQVAVEDKYGNLVTSDNSTITLTLASGTFWTGSSTAGAVASNGIATFNLSLYKAGTYTVAASDGSLTGVTSSPITINPAAAGKLVFQQAPPVSGTAGTTLSPVIVAVEDKYGNIVTSDNSTMTLTLSHGTFSNGSTSVTAQVVNGVATFSSLMINTAGTYQLAVTDGTLPEITSGNVAISSPRLRRPANWSSSRRRLPRRL